MSVNTTPTERYGRAALPGVLQLSEPPWFGKAMYYLFPLRRNVVLRNMRLVFGDVLNENEIRRLAQAYYGHFARFLVEFVRFPFLTAKGKERLVRVENKETLIRTWNEGKGMLLLTGHFGNWEVATTLGIDQFPEFRGWFYFVRRPLHPQWFNDFVTRRFRKAGFGLIAKRGSMERILDLLGKRAMIIYIFDQHADQKDGVIVDFLGKPAGTFKSVALLAMATGSPVVPASTWREPDGTHVIRFENPLQPIQCDDVDEAIRQNTRAYNVALERMLLRHPEQWIWMHSRWRYSKKEGVARRSPLKP
jgi:lauroyl/myristoyl acyltransferase